MAQSTSSSLDKFSARANASGELSTHELLQVCTEELELKSAVLDGLADGILVHTLAGTILYFNPAAAVVYGFPSDDFAKLDAYGWVPPDVGHAVSARVAALRETGVLDFQSVGLTPTGGTVATEVHARLITLPGLGEVVVSVIQNVTTRLEAQETMRHLAYHDRLTGLANRVMLDERLRMAMSGADRHGDVVGVVYLDLDEFKPVNDTFGHSAGDRVLRIVSERLMDCIREYDTVARLGGDEFLVLLPRLKSRDQLALAARKIDDCIKAPIDLDGREVRISAKLGLATYREGEAPDELISRADHAMYRGRVQGVDGWDQFGPTD